MNSPEDRVKVIYYPVYLNSVDGILDMNYYDGVAGCQLGLFASWYEPWGYTPLEGAALSVPVVTSNSSGFGQFIEKALPGSKGIYILDRLTSNNEVRQFVEIMYHYVQLSHHDRVHEKIQAKTASELADWQILVNNYIDAHNLALSK